MSNSEGKRRIADAFFACQDALRRYISRIAPSRAEVDDVVQETFVNVYSTKAADDIESPTAYIFTVASNVAARSRRRAARYPQRSLEEMEEIGEPGLISPEPDVEDQVHYRAKMAAFAEALAELPPQCRRVLVMRKVSGLSHAEIARELGISVSTIEKHVAKGMAICLAKLRMRGYESATPRHQISDRR